MFLAGQFIPQNFDNGRSLRDAKLQWSDKVATNQELQILNIWDVST